MVSWRGQPFARRAAQSGEIDAGIVAGEFLQFFERGGRQGLSAGAIAA